MALIHEFTTTKQANIQAMLADYNLLRDSSLVSPLVLIDDDLILYFADSLQGVESTNPRQLPTEHLSHQSLCYYGITLFFPHQVTHFKQVIHAWHTMFNLAPDELIITGKWTEIVGKKNSGEYEKISYKKADVLKQLADLIQLCEDVECDEALCLLHLGI